MSPKLGPRRLCTRFASSPPPRPALYLTVRCNELDYEDHSGATFGPLCSAVVAENLTRTSGCHGGCGSRRRTPLLSEALVLTIEKPSYRHQYCHRIGGSRAIPA